MEGALLRKWYGIPSALLIAILIGVGIAVAAFTYVYKVKPTVQWPVSEQTTESFNVASGHSFLKTKWLDLALPDNYNLTYKLTGDNNDHLILESAVISLDLNDDGTIELGEGEPLKTINKLGDNVTFENISGEIRQKIVISATARLYALVGTSWASGDQDPEFDNMTTSLTVSMEPTVP